ncbi:MAG: MFS transporter [Patescibacteria group bacterium]|nr:MFS transporter [Patescibacteria group bacterium]
MSTITNHRTKGILLRFLPFWIFLVFFKFGGALHYSLISPLGERLLPLWIVGLLMGGGSLIQLLLDVPAGYLLDRFGYLKLLKLTTFFFILAAVCIVFGLTTVTYIMSLVMATAGWLFFGPGVNAYALSQAEKSNAGRFMSLRDMAGSLGVVFSSAILPFVLLFAPQAIGSTILIVLAAALVALFFSPKDTVSVHAEKKLETHHYYIRRHYLRDVLRAIKKLNPASSLLLMLNLSSSIFYGIIWFVVPLVIAHQANTGMLGLGLGVFDFAVVVLGYALGNLADKVEKRTLIFFGLLIFSVSGMLLGFNYGWLFLLFGFLATTGDEMAGISLWSWMHALDREHAQDGAVSGVINLAEDLGWAIGPMLAGVLYGLIGSSWTIAVGALPILVIWIIYQIMFRNNPIRSLTSAEVPRKPHRPRHKK